MTTAKVVQMVTIVGWGVEKVQRASWKEKNVNLHSNSIGKIQQLEIIVEMKIDFHLIAKYDIRD